MKPLDQDIDQHGYETTSTPSWTRNKFLAAALMVASTSAVALGNGGGTGSSPVIPAPLAGKATFVDWDLPVVGAGECPSAIGAITLNPIDTPAVIDPVYYVTLCSQESNGRFGPSLVELRTEMHPSPAIWRAWNLGESPASSVFDPGLGDPFENPPAITGGMRLSSTNRVFVRTQSEVLRLDFTVSPVKITRFADTLLDTDPAAQSDVALVDRSGGYTDVWTAQNTTTLNPGSIAVPPTPPIFSTVPPGMVQRLTIGNSSSTASVTRYAVDGGAGLHYLSGIVSYQGKIYFSEGDPTTDANGRGNSISVLDPSTGDVHRFALGKVDPLVSGPRQLSVDASTGTLYAVTLSGHVVSFRPNSTCGNGLPTSAQMASYLIPGGPLLTDPRGVSPSGGTVAFSQTGFGEPVDGNKVGLLVPNKPSKKIDATVETVRKETFCLLGTPDTVTPNAGTVQGFEKLNLPTVKTDIDGKFFQAQLPDTGMFPLGILRDPFTCRKAFYVAVAFGGGAPFGEGGPNTRLSRVEFDTNPDPSPVPDLATPDSARPGLVSGGGTLGQDPTAIDTGDLRDLDALAPGLGQGSFDLVVYRNWTAAPPSGRITYVNKLTGDTVKSTAITSFSVNSNQATFGGTCTNSKTPLLPCTFQVTIQDNGYPGKGSDTFSITGVGLAPNQGTLTGGNIYVHRRNW